MSAAHLVAAALFLGISAYAIFGGADFGAGFWDLCAGGAERGARPRALVDHAIGPVWEANHVWLIFCLVMLWTGFPTAFASITLTMFIPLSIAALGIVLRGSGFAFRKVVPKVGTQRILAVFEPRSNTMKLGAMKAQLPWSLEEADLAFCHSGGLTWDAAQALAPMGAQAVVSDKIDELVQRVVAAARPGDHVLCMSNGGFGGIHAKLLDALAKRQ